MSALKTWPLFTLLAMAAAMTAAAPPARAQFAVIDVASVTQLMTQVRVLQQQLATTRNHLLQARQQLDSMRGGRGMERLLAGTRRNYLPPDWAALQGVLEGTAGAYGSLASTLRAAVDANAVLSAAQLAALGPRGQQQIEAARRSTALLQVLAREALVTTSGRFTSLQRLIDAIASAGDQKAILDLQARIAAEQNMLQNEQSKLQLLYQTARAQQQADRQRLREQVVAGHGRFNARFRPEPRQLMQ